jgi:hypothetical protein
MNEFDLGARRRPLQAGYTPEEIDVMLEQTEVQIEFYEDKIEDATLDLAHWTERRDELFAMREKHVDSTPDSE